MESGGMELLFAGGGTAGHMTPGLAVAEALRRCTPRARITFVGSGKPIEQRLVAGAGFDFAVLPCAPTPRRLRDAAAFLWRNAAGYVAARRLLDRLRPAAVVGLGGYAAAPLGWAATRAGVPLVLLEQNALPGRVTRWLAPRADLVCLAMEPARRHLPEGCRATFVGNPIREAFAPTATAGDQAREAPSRSRLRMVVLGGSLGARSLNEHVPRAVDALRDRLHGWRIVHQAGQTERDRTEALYRRLGLPIEVVDFVADMPGLLAGAGLAVCRAGGTTLAELAAAGVPAVLVPYPHAAGDHQRRNAEVYAAAGGATIVDERDGDGAGPLGLRLAEALGPLLDDPARRDARAAAMRRLARPHAATEVAKAVLRIAAGSRRPSVRAA